MPKESYESQSKSSFKDLIGKSQNFGNLGMIGGQSKLSDVAIMKTLESAMEEMVRFEVSE